METLSSGSFVGSGSFRCQHCGYALTLEGTETLTDCPSCGGRDFARASLFSTQRVPSAQTADQQTQAALVEPVSAEIGHRLQEIRSGLPAAGSYLVYEDEGELHTVALEREWTRIGRSLAADVRLDDPTVSRRHALLVHHPEGVRVLDDRSLNGVFVNGQRIDGHTLADGDEIIVGRYRLSFLSVEEEPAASAPSGSDPAPAGA